MTTTTRLRLVFIIVVQSSHFFFKYANPPKGQLFVQIHVTCYRLGDYDVSRLFYSKRGLANIQRTDIQHINLDTHSISVSKSTCLSTHRKALLLKGFRTSLSNYPCPPYYLDEIYFTYLFYRKPRNVRSVSDAVSDQSLKSRHASS